MNALLAGLLIAAADPTTTGHADAATDPVATPSGMSLAAPSPPPREIYEVHLAVDLPVTVVAGSAGLVRVFFKDSLARKSCPCDPAGINGLDRSTVGNHSAAAGVAADVTVYGVMAALPLVDLLDLGWGRAWAEDLMVYAETLAIDTALQNATNFIVARPRPRTYAGDPEFLASGEGYLSFYAGHVSTAFASLSMAAFTISRRYGEQVWPWIAAGLIGSSVAVERVASGHHFPTDVAVAALAGTAIGIGVPSLHLRRTGHVQIVPVGANGLGLAGSF
jgi:hypothetical protein